MTLHNGHSPTNLCCQVVYLPESAKEKQGLCEFPGIKSDTFLRVRNEETFSFVLVLIHIVLIIPNTQLFLHNMINYSY